MDDDNKVLQVIFDHMATPKMMVTKEADLPEAARIAAERVRADPQYQARRERFEEVVRRGPPVLAVLESNLPEGAAAQIIINPSSEIPRLVGVSPDLFSDKVLDLATHHLLTFELAAPAPSAHGVITLWPDGRLRLQVGSKTRNFKPTVEVRGSNQGQAERILARARKQQMRELHGLGKVRLVDLKGRKGESP